MDGLRWEFLGLSLKNVKLSSLNCSENLGLKTKVENSFLKSFYISLISTYEKKLEIIAI